MPRHGSVALEGDGTSRCLRVTMAAVKGDQKTIDGNHPLAGENLHLDVEVTHVRPATTEELTQGRVVGTGAPAH